MQKLATADEAAARSLMATLAPNITAATTAGCAAKFDMMARRRNLLCHPDDVEELDEMVESTAFAFAKSQKLRDTLKNEYHLISHYQIARPYLCQVSNSTDPSCNQCETLQNKLLRCSYEDWT